MKLSNTVNALQTLLSGSLLILAMVSAPLVTAAPAQPSFYTPDIEQTLETVFSALREQRLIDAGDAAETLAMQHPDFLLGQLLHAELQTVRAAQTTLLASDRPFSPRLLDLLLEAQVRVQESHHGVNESQVPTNLLQLGSDIKHVVAVDLEQSRLYLINNQHDGPRLINQHYAGSGRGGYGKLVEGDLRTPTGIYRVTQFRSGESLPDLYGSGALTLDYPNPVDRLQQRTGSGIWLHGVPSENLSRAPRSSEGCVVMPNDMLTLLQQMVEPANTLVMLSGHLDWTAAPDARPNKQPFLKLFERYRDAWSQQDQESLSRLHTDALYASAVAPRFGLDDDYPQTLAGINPADITVLRYPEFPNRQDQERIMMRFTLPATDQDHRLITLFWEQHAQNGWQIVHVGEELGPA
ncbi:MAG: L,D-transpeptidase [Gammaproteobacteria bacterium]|nr:L,D-transpeptidase [Gammaproteobacteria bacterium]